MIRGGTGRLRFGDLSRPRILRRTQNSYIRYFCPLEFSPDNLAAQTPVRGLMCFPFILPSNTRFDRLAYFTSTLSATTFFKIGFYTTSHDFISPWPGRLIWEEPSWIQLNAVPAGLWTDGDFNPPIFLPGNELLWYAFGCYDASTPGGSLYAIQAYTSGAAFATTAVPNIFGYSNPYDPFIGPPTSNCVYVYDGRTTTFSFPDPFPTDTFGITYRNIPLFGARLVSGI